MGELAKGLACAVVYILPSVPFDVFSLLAEILLCRTASCLHCMAPALQLPSIRPTCCLTSGPPVLDPIPPLQLPGATVHVQQPAERDRRLLHAGQQRERGPKHALCQAGRNHTALHFRGAHPRSCRRCMRPCITARP